MIVVLDHFKCILGALLPSWNKLFPNSTSVGTDIDKVDTYAELTNQHLLLLHSTNHLDVCSQDNEWCAKYFSVGKNKSSTVCPVELRNTVDMQKQWFGKWTYNSGGTRVSRKSGLHT